MAAQLDDFGYPVVTETGIRCGNAAPRTKHYHANVATVRECYAVAAAEKFEMEAELEVERRVTRYYEEGF